MKDKNIVVSIACLAHNHASYISQCLDNFVLQKTDFSFEILIHDDASIDGTTDIIRNYEAKYPNIIKPIYQTENEYSKGRDVFGINVSRARGKYIAICEGDDYWTDPYKLQKQVDFLENNDEYSMCFHNALVIYDDKSQKTHLFNDFQKDCDLSLQQALYNWYVPTASMVFRKDKILPLPNWVNKEHIFCGDQIIILMTLNAGKVRCLNDVMSVYRRFSVSSLSKRFKKGGLETNIYSNEQLIKLYQLYLNEVTGDKKFIIEYRINQVKNILRFLKALQSKNIIQLLFMPLFYKEFIKKIFRFFKAN